jgi:glutathione S-transferase
MSTLLLTIGSRYTSSWSLRPYLALAHTGADFDVRVVELDRPDSKANLLAVSPSGRVPALQHGDLLIWDSLAICEYLAETFPKAELWPRDPRDRARARAISAEMHAGFPALRRDMPFELRHEHPGQGHTDEALADARRVMDIWRECRAADPAGGPFLFGRFSIADAMYAPVTTRFATYAVPMDAVSQAYVAAIAALPAMQRWRAEV